MTVDEEELTTGEKFEAIQRANASAADFAWECRRQFEAPGASYADRAAAWQMDYYAHRGLLDDARVRAIKAENFPWLDAWRRRLPASIDPDAIR